MRKYFELQYKIVNRKLIDLGLHPLITGVCTAIAFTALSMWLFYKTPFTIYIYPGIALIIVLKLSEAARNSFLKNIFTLRQFYQLRLLENLLIILPFLLFLLYKNYFICSMALLLITIALIFYDSKNNLNLTLPTPFYKKPFEFIVGFRKSILFISLCYILTIIAIRYQNFNLGMFSLIIIFITCFSFYSQPETTFYVWIYKLNAQAFLINKIKTAIYFSSIICLPVSILLMLYFSANIYLIVGLQIVGYIYLSTVILAKYAAYPNNINLPQGLLLSTGLLFPPMLVGVIPFFYLQSIKRLKVILE